MQDLYGSSWPIRGWWPLLASLASFMVLGYSIPKYYRRRFGWFEPHGPSNRQVVIFLLIFVVLLVWGGHREMFANDLNHVIDSMVPHLNGQIELFPLARSIVSLSAGFLNRSRRTVDPHWIYFLGVGTIACALVAFYPFWDTEATQSHLENAECGLVWFQPDGVGPLRSHHAGAYATERVCGEWR
jgi:hypothetical protein